MAKSYWDQDLEEFNPYYSQFYNKDGSSKTSQNDDSKDSLRESERNALSNNEQSFYRGNGRSNTDRNKNKNNKLSRFFIARKKGMAGLILSLVLMVGGATFLSSTNSLLAPALNDKITEELDVQHASNSWRNRIILKYMMEGNTTKTTWKGSKIYTKMPQSTIKRLESNGIKVNGTGKNRTFTFNGKEITAADFNNIYFDDIEFREAYNRARRNRIIGFFDDKANNLATKLGLTRNTQKDYKQTGNAESDQKQYREVMEESTKNNNSGDLETTRVKNEVEQEEVKSSSSTVSGDNAQAKAHSYINKVAGEVQQVTSWGCTAAKLLTMISTMISALDAYNATRFALPILESSSKMKDGLGNESAINSSLNYLNTREKVSVEDFSSTPRVNMNTFDEGFQLELDTIETEGTPLESASLVSVLSDMPVNTKEAENYSLERAFNVLGGKITATANTFKTCAILQASTAIASIGITIATGGLKFLSSYVTRAIIGVIFNASFTAFLSFLIPTIAKSLFTNITEYAKGIPGGNLFVLGAANYNFKQAITGSSLAPSSKEKISAYNKLNEQVIALDNEIDRYNRSPFDITSKNTFLGSMAYNLATTTNSSKFTEIIKNLMSQTSSSLASITGNAMAASEKSYITTYGTCPFINSDEMYNSEGDMLCNAIPTSDLSTIELAADDDEYARIMAENTTCDDDGYCTINKKSELSKYITYCNGRESPWGAVDANILNSLKSLGGIGDTILSFLGSLPLIGDVIDILDAAADADNMRWATGAKCVNSNENPDWQTFKYFQRYVADQRSLTQMGAYEGSTDPVTAYIEEYEKENPVDNTPLGQLARISGLTKHDTELIVNVAYYYNFLDDYDASTRLAMDGTASDTLSGEEVIAKLDSDFRYKDFEKNFESDPYASEAIVAEHAIYADVRNRSYAV